LLQRRKRPGKALRSAALNAYGTGFGAAALIAACVALVACLLAFSLIAEEETAPAAE
jgi:hypothetical protein